MRAKAVLFDKDGTLFDFQKSWAGWIRSVILRMARNEQELAKKLAKSVGFNLETSEIERGSPTIAGTSEDSAILMLPHLPEMTLAQITRDLNEQAKTMIPVEVLPLAGLLDELIGMGLRLGVATNDNEEAARAHMQVFGLIERLDYIVGYDSGFGAKPAPGMCIEFARRFGISVTDVVMVGDSLHDLQAGRAAGMQTVAVLTGVATHDDLFDHADVVLPDIGHLPKWLVD